MRKLFAIVGIIGIILTIAIGCGDDDETIVNPSDNTPPAAITDLNIIGKVDTTAILSWTAPGDDGDLGTADSYDIRYSTDLVDLTNWTGANQAANPPSPDSAGSSELFMVTDLSIDSIYYFGIKTSDSRDNISPMSNIVQKTSSSFPIVEMVAPIDGSFIAEIVDLGATATDDKGVKRVDFFANDIKIGFDFAPPYQIKWNASTFPHGAGHILYAVATDGDSNQTTSNFVFCHTDTTLFLPEIPTIIDVSDITDSSAVITWSRNDDDDFFGYILYYDTTEAIDHDYSQCLAPIENRDDTSIMVVPLQDTAAYYFQLATVDNFAHTSYSNIDSCTTVNGIPRPVHLNYLTPFPDRVALTWSQSLSYDFQRYEVYRSLDENVTTDDLMLAAINEQDSTIFTDETVDPGQVYYYAVLVEDAGGLSSFSNVQNTEVTGGKYSLAFDGNDHCHVPYYYGLNMTTSFTLEAWVYPYIHGSFLRIVEKSESGCCLQYSLLLDNGKVGADLGIQNSSDYERVTGSYAIPTHEWSHIAVTFSYGQVCFYINGQLDICRTTDLTSLGAFPTGLNIGRRLLYNEFYYTGMIDEIRIWNTTRTEQEIQDSYTQPLLGTESGLVGYWRFDEGTGDTSTAIVGSDCLMGNAPGSDDSDPSWVEQNAPLGK